MFKFYKKRNFYELIGEDAILLNYLFAYPIFIGNFDLKINIVKKQLLKCIDYFKTNEISYTVYNFDDILECKDFKNKNYETALTSAKKENYNLIEIQNQLKNFNKTISLINKSSPKCYDIKYNQENDINIYMDSKKRKTFDDIINKYMTEKSTNNIINTETTTIDENDKQIKFGSKILLQKEDEELTKEYIIIDRIDSNNYYYANSKSKIIDSGNSFCNALLGKTEWDFVEYNGVYYQIVKVDNT